MRRFLLLPFLVLGLVGCQPKPPVVIVNQEQGGQQKRPPVPDRLPGPIPMVPSVAFLNGYHDGYHGHWLAPVRWVALNDYRHGWNFGAYDRSHGLPNRFDPRIP